ncbi:MAG: recombinase family protein [Bacillota bacterium]|nr:recombinase family protein [Bacillota bacterium]
MTRVAVYCRVSTEEQQEARSIENQVEYARRYCELNGVKVTAHYLDDGVTGTIPLEERPEGRRLLADAKAGKFDTVLIYKIDRLARKTICLLDACEKMKAAGVRLQSMTEPFDTSTPVGQFILTMLGSMATLERETILERTSLGKDRILREGKWPGGPPPLGYRVGEDGRLEIEPREAEIVRRIFHLYTQERMGSLAIADLLNAEGVPLTAEFKNTHRARQGVWRWRASRVLQIVADPVYMGQYHYRKGSGEVVIVEVPPVVTEQVWRQAEQTRKQNRKEALRNTKQPYLLRGLVTCTHCGSPYAGDGQVRSTYRYYRCLGNKNVDRRLGQPCPSKAVRADVLEGIVWEDICEFVRNPGALLGEVEARLSQEPAAREERARELENLARSLARCGEERARLINIYRKGLIDEAELERELGALAREASALEERKAALLAAEYRAEEIRTQALNARTVLEQLRDKLEAADPAAKRELVQALVEKIEVTTITEENGKRIPHVTIRYRFNPPIDPNNSDCKSGVLGPRKPNISPAPTWKLTRSTARVPPAYRLVSSSVSTIASPVMLSPSASFHPLTDFPRRTFSPTPDIVPHGLPEGLQAPAQGSPVPGAHFPKQLPQDRPVLLPHLPQGLFSRRRHGNVHHPPVRAAPLPVHQAQGRHAPHQVGYRGRRNSQDLSQFAGGDLLPPGQHVQHLDLGHRQSQGQQFPPVEPPQRLHHLLAQVQEVLGG